MTFFYVAAGAQAVLLSCLCPFLTGEVQKEMVESVSGSQVTSVEEDSGLGMSGHMIQAVFSMLWSTVVLELWKRRSSTLSYQWGTLRLAERFAEPRPAFHGELGVNPVTGRVEPLFPEWKREVRLMLVSVPVVGMFLGTAPPPVECGHSYYSWSFVSNYACEFSSLSLV